MNLEELSTSERGLHQTSAFDRQRRDIRNERELSTKDSTSGDPTKDLTSDVDSTTALEQISQHDDAAIDRMRTETSRTYFYELDHQGRRSSKERLPEASILSQQALPIRQDHEDQTKVSFYHALIPSSSGSPRVSSSQSVSELASDEALPVHCACPRITSMTEPSVVVEWLDWTWLFFLLLTSGSTFIACLTSMPPSCLVTFVFFASFISFPLRCLS